MLSINVGNDTPEQVKRKISLAPKKANLTLRASATGAGKLDNLVASLDVLSKFVQQYYTEADFT